MIKDNDIYKSTDEGIDVAESSNFILTTKEKIIILSLKKQTKIKDLYKKVYDENTYESGKMNKFYETIEKLKSLNYIQQIFFSMDDLLTEEEKNELNTYSDRKKEKEQKNDVVVEKQVAVSSNNIDDLRKALLAIHSKAEKVTLQNQSNIRKEEKHESNEKKPEKRIIQAEDNKTIEKLEEHDNISLKMNVLNHSNKDDDTFDRKISYVTIVEDNNSIIEIIEEIEVELDVTTIENTILENDSDDSHINEIVDETKKINNIEVELDVTTIENTILENDSDDSHVNEIVDETKKINNIEVELDVITIENTILENDSDASHVNEIVEETKKINNIEVELDVISIENTILENDSDDSHVNEIVEETKKINNINDFSIIDEQLNDLENSLIEKVITDEKRSK